MACEYSPTAPTYDQMIDAYDKSEFSYYKKLLGIKLSAFVTNDNGDDLTQLLAFAEEGDYKAFIDGLSWVAWSTNGKPKPTVFIFPETLTSSQRHSIHRMQRGLVMKSRTLGGKLHVFLADFA
jgi:hypothetical protein